MTRRLLNLLAAVSLLTCVAVVALWVRSGRHADEVVFRPTNDLTIWSFASAEGEVVFTSIRHKGFSRKRNGDDFRYTHSPVDRAVRGLHGRIRALHTHRFFGVGWTPPDRYDNPATTWATVPYNHIAILASLLPAGRATAWLWRRALRRKRGGRCPQCGYDLTGNVSGVCPECGRGAARG